MCLSWIERKLCDSSQLTEREENEMHRLTKYLKKKKNNKEEEKREEDYFRF